MESPIASEKVQIQVEQLEKPIRGSLDQDIEQQIYRQSSGSLFDNFWDSRPGAEQGEQRVTACSAFLGLVSMTVGTTVLVFIGITTRRVLEGS
ncbi:hypothetical protein BT63DRAFT_481596 [Microthyrium microscopicum]|uniref:Uncharacterized protein n=1 Tax=Microthyrium microscopicum TaxID=703497 RepID=A0A6A6U6T6_9PEZI|nr:hypothetical protein BT63DRAFT_481596 [Microthyrium microscopicum]